MKKMIYVLSFLMAFAAAPAALAEQVQHTNDAEAFRPGRPGPGPGRPGPGRPGHPGNPGRPPGRPPGPPPGHRPPPPPPHRPPAPPSFVRIQCGSEDYRTQECYVGRQIRSARIERQFSRQACVYGQTWGLWQDRIWVSQGCRAQFLVEIY